MAVPTFMYGSHALNHARPRLVMKCIKFQSVKYASFITVQHNLCLVAQLLNRTAGGRLSYIYNGICHPL